MSDQIEIYRVWVEKQLDAIREIGIFAIKALMTLNSGAIVVIFSLFGALATQEHSLKILELSTLKQSVMLFAGGIAMLFFSILFTYIFAQTSISDYEVWLKPRPGWMVFWVVLPVALSLILFLCGAFVAISAVSR